MNIAFVNSNFESINKYTRKGTEIFSYMLVKNFVKYTARRKDISFISFASSDSHFPIKTESLGCPSALSDKSIGPEHHKIFELALLSKAFSMQEEIDIYHINIGNGESVLPFARFVNKPIIITLHGNMDTSYGKNYYPLYKNLDNVHFVSISDFQRCPIPDLNYIRTIYHGIDIHKNFKFNPKGGNRIMWAGRGVPEKGPDTVLKIIKKLKRQAKLFFIIKAEYSEWLQEEVIKRKSNIDSKVDVSMDFNLSRLELSREYQSSKLFLFPVRWDEPFGLTMIESMASGTPVVAYARGSVPEIVKDGVTGFIVNPSEDDIRGNWIIKKTGIEGLCEAIERIYSLSNSKYLKMREKSRLHVKNNFSVEYMVRQYLDVYSSLHNLHKRTNRENKAILQNKVNAYSFSPTINKNLRFKKTELRLEID